MYLFVFFLFWRLCADDDSKTGGQKGGDVSDRVARESVFLFIRLNVGFTLMVVEENHMIRMMKIIMMVTADDNDLSTLK